MEVFSNDIQFNNQFPSLAEAVMGFVDFSEANGSDQELGALFDAGQFDRITIFVCDSRFIRVHCYDYSNEFCLVSMLDTMAMV